MANVLADIGLVAEIENVSTKGDRVSVTNRMLEAFGISDRKADVLPVVEVSKRAIPPSTPIQLTEFFSGNQNTKSTLRNVAFPAKLKAYFIDSVRVDLDSTFKARCFQ